MQIRYKILLIASFICSFADNLIGPFYAVFVQKIGGSILTIGYSYTLTMLATGILIIIIGRLSDTLNKEWVTICGYSLYALGALGYLFVSRPWQLFVLSVVFAIGTACLSSPLQALMSRVISKKQEGLQWALAGGGDKIILGLSVLAGTLIVKYSGFETLFIIMFILQVLAVLVQLQLLINKKIKSNKK
jgi:MFS family permease